MAPQANTLAITLPKRCLGWSVWRVKRAGTSAVHRESHSICRARKLLVAIPHGRRSSHSL